MLTKPVEQRCTCCGAPLKNLGYWTTNGRVDLFKCVTRGCDKSTVNHAPVDTTFAGRNWI